MKLVVIGVAGSGKSTQCQLLEEKLGVPHLSMGAILREASGANTAEAKLIKQTINRGELVDVALTIRILKSYLSKPECDNGYILDGFPRDLQQFSLFPTVIDKAIVIKLSDSEATARLLKRKDDRTDDTPEVIATRIKFFHEGTEPLIARLRSAGMLIEVNGEQTVEKVHEEIMTSLDKL